MGVLVNKKTDMVLSSLKVLISVPGTGLMNWREVAELPTSSSNTFHLLTGSNQI